MISQPYEEIVEGERLWRHAPGDRHESICMRLHRHVSDSLANVSSATLLEPRSVVQLSAGTYLRPDLALVTKATNRLWLVAEVISSNDHQIDTVTKKTIYEELNLPRLWMVDPRYNNVEVYNSTQYGLSLKHIFSDRETLTEELLPELQVILAELFAA